MNGASVETIDANSDACAAEPPFRALIEHISDAIALLSPTGTILYSGPSTARILGYAPGENVGSDAFTLVHPDDRANAQQALVQLIATPAATGTLEMRLKHRDGTWRNMEGIARNLLHEPAINGIVVTYRDVTERKRAEAALRESEERYRSMVVALDEGIILQDANGTITAVNESVARILSIDRDALVGRSAMDVHGITFYEDGSPFPPEEHPSTVALETGHPQRGVVMGLDKQDGTRIWISINAQPLYRDGASTPYGVVSSFTDITERKRFEARLTHAAHHDALTRLPNRALFVDRLTRLFGQTKRRKHYRFALFFLDFDRFKVVNDTYGHSIGDLLLVAIAERLRECLRPDDVVARLAGDEFAILVAEIDEPVDALHVAARLHDAFATPFVIKRRELAVTVSIGIALSRTGYESPEELLRDADAAMYRAKLDGRGQSVVADTVLRTRLGTRTQLETDLRDAIARNELDITFNPVVRLATDRAERGEIALSWRHPSRGYLSSEEINDIVEETGLHIAIDRLLLATACQQARAYHDGSNGDTAQAITVPIHHTSLLNAAFVEEIETAVRRAALPPHSLTVQITAAMLTEHTQIAATTFERLHAMGIRIQIDRFGDGKSSLPFMRRFPIHAVKLDQSFARMVENASEREVVRALITLAHTMQIEIVADSIDTQQHYLFLRDAECDFGQGAYFRPIDCR